MSRAIWITGRPGSGTSAITPVLTARHAEGEGPAPDADAGERCLDPDMTIATHARDPWSATRDLEELARRLHRAAGR